MGQQRATSTTTGISSNGNVPVSSDRVVDDYDRTRGGADEYMRWLRSADMDALDPMTL
jgi:hypothetical protein